MMAEKNDKNQQQSTPSSSEQPLSPEEQTYLNDLFQMVDNNADGYIDVSDLDKLFKRLNMKASLQDLKAMIAKQRNPDSKAPVGYIDFKEFSAMMLNADLHQSLEAETRQLFGAINKRKNGQISLAELSGFMGAVGIELTDEEANQMFSAADKNKDGFITYDEFAAIVALVQKQRGASGKNK